MQGREPQQRERDQSRHEPEEEEDREVENFHDLVLRPDLADALLAVDLPDLEETVAVREGLLERVGQRERQGRVALWFLALLALECLTGR